MCLVLAACGSSESVRESLGLNNKGPDEFQVYSRPPLTVPPEFSLRPPQPGSEHPISASVEDQAHNKILGTSGSIIGTNPSGNTVQATAAAVPSVSSSKLEGNADSQFLTNAGADKADKNIRQVITDDSDNGVAPKDSKYLITPGEGTDPVVDASKEADRLKQDKAQNKPPTEGETPVIEPQSKGIIGDLF